MSAHPSVIHDRCFEGLKDCAASAALGLRESLSGRDGIAISLGLARPRAIRSLGFEGLRDCVASAALGFGWLVWGVSKSAHLSVIQLA